jgi:hypothetical protein
MAAFVNDSNDNHIGWRVHVVVDAKVAHAQLPGDSCLDGDVDRNDRLAVTAWCQRLMAESRLDRVQDHDTVERAESRQFVHCLLIKVDLVSQGVYTSMYTNSGAANWFATGPWVSADRGHPGRYIVPSPAGTEGMMPRVAFAASVASVAVHPDLIYAGSRDVERLGSVGRRTSMPKDERHFHFLAEGRERLQFFWNVVFAGRSVEEARARLVQYFEREGIELTGIDEEETKEVDLSDVARGWLKAAQPEFHLVAAAGRIWVGSSEPDS